MLKWNLILLPAGISLHVKEMSWRCKYGMKWKSVTEVLQSNADMGDEKVLIYFQ